MNNNRNTRVQKAEETLQIIEQGYYTINHCKVDVQEQVRQSVNETILYTDDSFKQMSGDIENEIANRNFQTTIAVKNCTSMEAAEELLNRKEKIGCLNFASAKNPGGGFLSGAQAQEESLARASSLYPTQTKYLSEMYEYNRKRNTYLYSNHMIYSPGVVFFRNDEDELLTEPYLMDVLTSPAVNIGAMKQNKPEELLLAEQTMLSRMDKLLSVFVQHKVQHIILGAWGCGVFQNKPEDVARYFAKYLTSNGKYANCFQSVVFAVFDRSKNQENITAFEKVLLT